MSGPGKQPAIFAVLEYGEFPELLRVAETLAPTLDSPPVIFFVKRSYRRLAEDTAEVAARGFHWMDAQGRMQTTPCPVNSAPHVPPSAAPQGSLPTIHMPEVATGRNTATQIRVWACLPLACLGWLSTGVFQSVRQSGRECANFLRDRRRFRQRFGELKAALEKSRASVLVVGQDGPASDLSLLLIAAGELRIPRVVTPFAMFSLQETADYAAAREDHNAKSGALNRLLARLFPQWVLHYGGQRLLRLPGYRALALETTGLIRGLPWTPLSEPVEAVTADSEVSAAALAILGVDRSRLKVVGSPAHDRLAAHLQNMARVNENLCREHGLDPNKPLLLCGWPVNMFAWLSGRPVAYDSYEAVAASWARILAHMSEKHRVNVIVSIHPKTLDSEYQAALDQGLACRRGGVEELIAACDVFTTLNGSSITSWAIACSKPVLLFDCFQTRYTDFLNVPGCTSVDTEEAFSNAIDRLCASRAYRQEMADSMRQVSGQWGRLDGQANARMIRVFQDVADQGRP